VDALPITIFPLPDPRFLRPARLRASGFVDKLNESDVGDAGGIFTEQVYVGVEDGRVGRPEAFMYP